MLQLTPVLLSLPLLALDDPIPGFATEQLGNSFSRGSATLSTGEYVALDFFNINVYAKDGTFLRTLHSFSEPVAGAWVAIDPTETFCVFSRNDADSSETWRVNLDAGPATFVSSLSGRSIVFEDANTVLLESLDGFGARIIYRIELTTGASEQVIVLGGSSGQLSIADSGNLYLPYRTPGPGEVLRYSAAQLTSGAVLTRADAHVVVTGSAPNGDIDGLVVLPDESALYLLDGGGIFEWVGGSPPRLLSVVTEPNPLYLEWLEGPGPAEYLEYQPPGGGEIVYTVFRGSGTNRGRRSLVPARPVAAVSGLGTTGVGLFDLTVTGGPPSGTAFAFYGPSADFVLPEPAYNFGLPLFFGLGLATAGRVPGALSLDANGEVTVSYSNDPGTLGWAIQVVLFDDTVTLVGSSSAAFF
jgi:hypothetical protein